MSDDFEPVEKAIYGYANGSGKKVFADPLLLEGALKTLAIAEGKTLQGLIDETNALDAKDKKQTPEEEAASWSALQTLAKVSMLAFELVEFDPATGQGADMAHALGVLNHFNLWCEKKNQRPASISTSSRSAESASEIQKITDGSSASP